MATGEATAITCTGAFIEFLASWFHPQDDGDTNQLDSMEANYAWSVSLLESLDEPFTKIESTSKKLEYTFASAGVYFVECRITFDNKDPFDPDNKPHKDSFNWEVTVQESRFKVIDAGDYIVPGCFLNAVRYNWTENPGAPQEVSMQVVDSQGETVRFLENLSVTPIQGKDYAEAKWDDNWVGDHPLWEDGSPYDIRLIATWNDVGPIHYRAARANVEEWKMSIRISDKPSSNETLVTGPDEDSITSDTLVITISLPESAQKPCTPTFKVSEAQGIPQGSRYWWVTPNYIFYTTPSAPYDIRYTVVIEQKTTLEHAAAQGLVLKTIVDGTTNPWDMDPSTPGRQTKCTWEFGISSSGGVPVRRNPTEDFE